VIARNIINGSKATATGPVDSNVSREVGSFIPAGVMKSLRASKVFCVIDLIHHLPLILEVKEVVTITVKELLKGNAPVHLFEVAIWPKYVSR